MQGWEPGAVDALENARRTLDQRGVTRWLEQSTRDMWLPNAARYEPSHLFDTPRGIAAMAMENLRELLLADYRSPDGTWRDEGVRLSLPQGSLLIEVPPLRLHIVKAPGLSLRDPDWAGFEWDASQTRLAAAQANTSPLAPVSGHRHVRGQLSLVDSLSGERARRWNRIREVFFVWAGDEEGRTAGWLGLPCASPDRWLAVQVLWRDEAARIPLVDDAAASRPAAGSFSDQEAPAPVLTLKPHQGQVDQ